MQKKRKTNAGNDTVDTAILKTVFTNFCGGYQQFWLPCNGKLTAYLYETSRCSAMLPEVISPGISSTQNDCLNALTEFKTEKPLSAVPINIYPGSPTCWLVNTGRGLWAEGFVLKEPNLGSVRFFASHFYDFMLNNRVIPGKPETNDSILA